MYGDKRIQFIYERRKSRKTQRLENCQEKDAQQRLECNTRLLRTVSSPHSDAQTQAHPNSPREEVGTGLPDFPSLEVPNENVHDGMPPWHSQVSSNLFSPTLEEGGTGLPGFPSLEFPNENVHDGEPLWHSYQHSPQISSDLFSPTDEVLSLYTKETLAREHEPAGMTSSQDQDSYACDNREARQMASNSPTIFDSPSPNGSLPDAERAPRSRLSNWGGDPPSSAHAEKTPEELALAILEMCCQGKRVSRAEYRIDREQIKNIRSFLTKYFEVNSIKNIYKKKVQNVLRRMMRCVKAEEKGTTVAKLKKEKAPSLYAEKTPGELALAILEKCRQGERVSRAEYRLDCNTIKKARSFLIKYFQENSVEYIYREKAVHALHHLMQCMEAEEKGTTVAKLKKERSKIEEGHPSSTHAEKTPEELALEILEKCRKSERIRRDKYPIGDKRNIKEVTLFLRKYCKENHIEYKHRNKAQKTLNYMMRCLKAEEEETILGKIQYNKKKMKTEERCTVSVNIEHNDQNSKI